MSWLPAAARRARQALHANADSSRATASFQKIIALVSKPDAVLPARPTRWQGQRPEGTTTYAALPRLVQNGFLNGMERIVLFNTGMGIKY
jgi:hypothetical protein